MPVSPGTTAEWPEDTNTIESLTPEQARKLAEEFPGVEVEFEVVRAGKSDFKYKRESCLPLNVLKKFAPNVARALAGYRKGPLLLNGLTPLDAAVNVAPSRASADRRRRIDFAAWSPYYPIP